MIENNDLIEGFSKLLDHDLTQFHVWLGANSEEISGRVKGSQGYSWLECFSIDVRKGEEYNSVLEKLRSQKLKKLIKKDESEEAIYKKLAHRNSLVIQEAHKVEAQKLKKYKSDYKQMQTTLESEWRDILQQLNRERAILGVEEEANVKWKLDFTEGTARLRKKMRRSRKSNFIYQSKSEKVVSN
jgi:hypothetical protein